MTSDRLLAAPLRDALNHLYDLEFLSKSPLVQDLGLRVSGSAGTALLQVLQSAIQELRPTDERLDTRQQRIYRVLHYRYVDHLTQAETARRLGLTDRHVRREQQLAIDVLAHRLRQRYAVELADAPDAPADTPDEAEEDMAREMLWLADSLGEQACDLGAVVAESLQVAAALVQQKGLALLFEADGPLPRVAIPETVLKQVLLNLISSAICLPEARRMVLVAQLLGPQLALDILGDGLVWGEEDLEVSRQLVRTFGGELVSRSEGGSTVPRVLLNRADRVVILAVEDNRDTLQLWQRFLRNTRFQLEVLMEAGRTLERASELLPDLILLDVMMPEVDGWGLLHQLRQHPRTAQIPVIICTVLPQEQLARSLGADGFIRKPIKGHAFRAQLERQIEASGHV